MYAMEIEKTTKNYLEIKQWLNHLNLYFMQIQELYKINHRIQDQGINEYKAPKIYFDPYLHT